MRRLVLFAVLGVLALGLLGANRPGVHAQADLSCDLHALNVVGAHAGTLNLRIGVDGSCDRAGTYELIFPGGALLRGATPDGLLHLTQDAAVCGTGPYAVVARYVAEDGAVWQASLPIENEDGSVLSTGRDCDVLLQRGVTPVRWQGAMVAVPDAFADALPPDLRAIWLFDPLAQTWTVWGSDVPASLQGFTLLVPGLTYWFVNSGDFEIPLRFPASTEVVHFLPARPDPATSVSGSCFSSSLAASGRTDAWRCATGNELHDPCFALDAATVVCGANPATDETGFLLDLTEPLPEPEVTPEAIAAASVNGWLVRLADGMLCNFATGATGGVDGTRANYACADDRWILGDLIPGEPWLADIATISVTVDGWQADTRAEVPIAVVWQ